MCSAILVTLHVAPASLAAQRLFAHNWEPVDAAKYTRLRDCLARVEWHESEAQSTAQESFRDTNPPGIRRISHMSDAMVADVKKCAAHFQVEPFLKTPGLGWGEIEALHGLLLKAGRDAEARTLVDRYVALPENANDTTRRAINRRVVVSLLSVRPARLQDAWTRVEAMQFPGGDDWANKILLAGEVLGKARVEQDDAMAQRAARWLYDVPAQVPERERATDLYEHRLRPILIAAYDYLHRQDQLDSIGTNDQAVKNYMTSMLRHVRLPKGIQAQKEKLLEKQIRSRPLTGAYWFPKAPDAARPTPGKFNLVYVLPSERFTTVQDDRNCHGNRMFNGCKGMAARLKRLAEQFPEMDMTIVAKTQGMLGNVIAQPTAAEEAALLDSLYRKTWKIPSTLVVAETPYWRVPSGDRRVRYEPVANDTSGFEPKGLYLVSPNGMIITSMDPWGEYARASEREREFVAQIKRALARKDVE